MRADGSRSDSRENRERLVQAVGRVLATGKQVSLTAVADEAGVSRSTTYRNFSTPGEAVLAYITAFLDDFESEITCSSGKTAGITVICQAWGKLVEQRSTALVHVRSTEGFLTRVRRGDPVICRIERVVRDAIHSDPDLPRFSDQDLDYAVFLWNLMLDPREILDLAEHTNTTVAEATERLACQFLGCLLTVDTQVESRR